MIFMSKRSWCHVLQGSQRFKKKDLGNIPKVYDYSMKEIEEDGDRPFSDIPVKRWETICII